MPVRREPRPGWSWFLDRVDDYREQRDRPDWSGSSQLSPDLRFGTLSPRTVIDVVGVDTPGPAALVRQLAWRDWYAHTLAERPEMVDRPAEARVRRIWHGATTPRDSAAWKEGRTGCPDGRRRDAPTASRRAGCTTGCAWSSASFLTKNLLVDWRLGERWFRHHLTTATWPRTSATGSGWRGPGPDASPFHRVFNPVLQGKKFDPNGVYVRRWVPELAALPDDLLHAPWEAGPLDLAAAGVELGSTYPFPVVDLKESRERALAAYEEVRRT